MLDRASHSRMKHAPSAISWIKWRAARPMRMPPLSRPLPRLPGLTSAALAAALQTSHHTMPNLVIKGDAANNIIAYILSLKESD